VIERREIDEPERLITPKVLDKLYDDLETWGPDESYHHVARAEIEGRFALYAAITSKQAAELALQQAVSSEAAARARAEALLTWSRALVVATAILALATIVLAIRA
jgi:hypothetical protein